MLIYLWVAQQLYALQDIKLISLIDKNNIDVKTLLTAFIMLNSFSF